MVHTLSSNLLTLVNCYANETLKFYNGGATGGTYNEAAFFEIGTNGQAIFVNGRAGFKAEDKRGTLNF